MQNTNELGTQDVSFSLSNSVIIRNLSVFLYNEEENLQIREIPGEALKGKNTDTIMKMRLK